MPRTARQSKSRFGAVQRCAGWIACASASQLATADYAFDDRTRRRDVFLYAAAGFCRGRVVWKTHCLRATACCCAIGALGQMLLVSAVFGMVASLGLQSVVSRDLPALIAGRRERRGLRLLAQTIAVAMWIALLCLLELRLACRCSI